MTQLEMPTPSSPKKPPEFLSPKGQEALIQYFEYFSKHLSPPYIYDLPDRALEPGEPDYYYYMCRGNILQAVSGFMNLVQKDSGLLHLQPAQAARIKTLENKILSLPANQKRTPEEMAMIKESMEEIVRILGEQKARFHV